MIKRIHKNKNIIKKRVTGARKKGNGGKKKGNEWKSREKDKNTKVRI